MIFSTRLRPQLCFPVSPFSGMKPPMASTLETLPLLPTTIGTTAHHPKNHNHNPSTLLLEKCNSIKELRQIHQCIEESGIKLNLILENALLVTYATCGRMDEAANIFEKMPVKDIISWTAMVTGFTDLGKVDKARELFDQPLFPISSSSSTLFQCPCFLSVYGFNMFALVLTCPLTWSTGSQEEVWPNQSAPTICGVKKPYRYHPGSCSSRRKLTAAPEHHHRTYSSRRRRLICSNLAIVLLYSTLRSSLLHLRNRRCASSALPEESAQFG
ncbi:hypothetical protein EJ110_NYTH52441 [Nymphaea thermarum]|nr:hypothetical protein EJ110_NYTH52441 [Nymphaea thermarum]